MSAEIFCHSFSFLSSLLSCLTIHTLEKIGKKAVSLSGYLKFCRNYLVSKQSLDLVK